MKPKTRHCSLSYSLCNNHGSYIHSSVPLAVATTILFYTVLCFFNALAAN